MFYWDGTSIIQITNNSYRDEDPSIYDGTIAWQAYNGDNREIFYWDGSTIRQITNDSVSDHLPSLFNGTIAWQKYGGYGQDTEIMYFDGDSIIQVTNNDTFDVHASLHDGAIAWTGFDGFDQEMFYAFQSHPTVEIGLDLKTFIIGTHKPTDRTYTKMFGEVMDLPELNLGHGDTVEVKITIEVPGVVEGNRDLVISGVNTLDVRDWRRWYLITK
jgi:hypothetical protein